ncbi:MAG: hypothetical protein ABIP42_15980 [Planctomycetota bacterium]
MTGVVVAGAVWTLIEFGWRTHEQKDSRPAEVGLTAKPGSASTGTVSDPAVASARIRELEGIVEAQAAQLAALSADMEQLRRTPVAQPAAETPPSEKMEVETDQDGHVLAKGMVRNGLRVGAWELWWPNGQKQMEGSYLDGKKSGVWKTWSADGTDAGSGRYVDDLREGRWIWIDKDGRRNEFEFSLGEPKDH